MDWRVTLGTMDDSLKAALARKQLEQSGLLDILGTQEGLRRNRASEALQGRQIDEQAKDREELARLREIEQQALSEQRAALASKYRQDVDQQTAHDQNVQALVQEWATAPPERKKAIEFTLRAQYNANLPAAENAGNDFMSVSPGATVFSKSQGKAVFHAPPNPTATGGGHGAKPVGDNPRLPNGVQDYLMAMRTGQAGKKDAQGRPIPYSLDEARAELGKAWPQIRAAHPNVSLQDVSKALTDLYTNPIASRAAEPLGQVQMVIDGQTFTFPSQEAADAAKAEAESKGLSVQ